MRMNNLFVEIAVEFGCAGEQFVRRVAIFIAHFSIVFLYNCLVFILRFLL